MKFINHKAIGLTFLMCSVSPLAFAQSEEAGEQPAGDTQSERTLDQVVVTATRREVALQDVPVTVSAITDESLAGSGVTDVRELTFVVPGYNGGRTFAVVQPTLRGVGWSGISPSDEPNIAIYVDGIYQPSAQGNIVDFGEVERVEVLRGPQGTLFGRNATGGLVNVITPDPSFSAAGQVSGQYSWLEGENAAEVKGYFTGPITDKVAADINLLYSSTDPYINNLASGQKVGGTDSYNIRTKLLFQPSESFSSILTLGYADRQSGDGNVIAPLGGNTAGNLVPGNIVPTEPFDVAIGIPSKVGVQQYTATLRNSLDLGSVRLETSSGYLDDKVKMNTDADASPVLISQNIPRTFTEAWSHEIRLLSQNESNIEWIVGGYYFDMNSLGIANVFSGVAPTYTTVGFNRLVGDATVESLAAFGEVTWHATDKLNLVGGLRYTTEDRGFTQEFNGTTVVSPTSRTYDKMTYRATAQYFFTPNTNAYLTYSTGFKSGVYNSYGFAADPVRPETLDSVELGLKSDPLPWLRTNVSVFNYDYDDLQVTARASDAVGTSTFLLLNAAKAEIRGIDLEVQAALDENFSISANGEVLDAEYASFPNAQDYIPVIGAGGLPVGNSVSAVDASGNDMIRAPRYTYSLNATWTKPLSQGELAFNTSLFGSAKVYHDFNGRLAQPAYTRLNAQVSWESADEDWRLVLFGTNITNETIYAQASATPVGDIVIYERPREVGVRIERKF